jgi:hypothetical protein
MRSAADREMRIASAVGSDETSREHRAKSLERRRVKDEAASAPRTWRRLARSSACRNNDLIEQRPGEITPVIKSARSMRSRRARHGNLAGTAWSRAGPAVRQPRRVQQILRTILRNQRRRGACNQTIQMIPIERTSGVRGDEMATGALSRPRRSVARNQDQQENCCSPPRQSLDGSCPHLFIHRPAVVAAGEDQLPIQVLVERGCDVTRRSRNHPE